MMKLKTMAQVLTSDSLARELLQNWEHDEDSLRFWRASSNFVYVFRQNNANYFLRFAHEQERSMQEIETELEFLQYLKLHDYPAVSPSPSKNGHFIEALKTHHGTYYAVVFHEAIGTSLDLNTMSAQHFEALGQSLGALHHLSKTYQPVEPIRKSWKDVLQFVRTVLDAHPQEKEATIELQKVEQCLHSLPATDDQYGLIHYDFELDNLFWNQKTAEFHVIDFDDSMYHWYTMDITSAVADLKEYNPAKAESYLCAFLKGYRSKMTFEKDWLPLMPRFERFANLYKFARLLHSLQESDFCNAPTWLDHLKTKLTNVCEQKRAGFRKPW